MLSNEPIFSQAFEAYSADRENFWKKSLCGSLPSSYSVEDLDLLIILTLHSNGTVAFPDALNFLLLDFEWNVCTVNFSYNYCKNQLFYKILHTLLYAFQKLSHYTIWKQVAA